MNNSVTPMLFLSFIMGFIALFVPEYSTFYLMIILILFIPLVLFSFYLDLTGKNRSRKKRGYAGYFNFLLFSIFLCLPAVKLNEGHLPFQITIVGIWIILYIIGFVNKAQMLKMVLPDADTPNKLPSLLFWGFIVLLIAAGGGGFYKSAEYFARLFGHSAAMSYFSYLLLLLGYCFLLFAQGSLAKFPKFKN
jgi:hypothetical protein